MNEHRLKNDCRPVFLVRALHSLMNAQRTNDYVDADVVICHIPHDRKVAC
ncbi:MAG: hypothetical protein RIS44_791 [Pseudomonadota bacterium]|jgi:hypothetical protein